MVHHYEYSTINSHHKVLVNLHASNTDALKVKAACRLVKIVFSRLLHDGAGSRLHFLNSFNLGCYHRSTMEIIL